MAAKKKARRAKKGKKVRKAKRAKRVKKVAKRKPTARRKVAKKAAKKRVSKAKKKIAKKKKAVRRTKAPAKRKTAKAAATPVPMRPMSVLAGTPVALDEERIGVVTHYYSHLAVAVIELDSGVLREGDTIHIKGHTSDFTQKVGSMEVNHMHVSESRAGQSFGLKVIEHAREHDAVYLVKSP